MFKWLTSLPDVAKGAVYGALIGAVVSVIVYLLTFLIKDYLIPILLEKRKAKREAIEAFKKYKNPLMQSSEALAYRFKEIFENRSFYLLKDAPKTEFYVYKYVNTLYRLSSLLGYIRALKVELLHLSVSNKKQFSKIENAIKNFERSLADGQDVEKKIVENICATWNLRIGDMEDGCVRLLGSKIDNTLNEVNYRNKVKCANDLNPPEQEKLVLALKNVIEEESKKEVKTKDLKVSTIVNELSIKEAYIYRDWQQSIGDLMLDGNSSTNNRLSVIGYKKFEEYFWELGTVEKKWISRIEKLFQDLDVKLTDQRFDARVVQLKRIYISTIDIILAFKCIKTGIDPVAKSSLDTLKAFKESLT